MNGTDELLTTAELALALGGFGSVVAAFIGNRTDWDPMDVVRFRALIVISLGSALIALLPFPLYYGGLEASTMWAAASTLAYVIATIGIVWMLRSARAPMATHGSPLWSAIAMLVASLAVVINLLNSLGIGFTRSFTGYFTGLLLLLILAGLYFIRLIVLSGPQARPAARPGQDPGSGSSREQK